MQEKNQKKSKNFGTRLAQVRKLSKLTQAEFAARLGYNNPVQVNRWERNKAFPPYKALIDIAGLTGADLHWLMTGGPCTAVSRLLPFVLQHLGIRSQQIEELERERADLRIRETLGEDHSRRLDEIARDVETLESYCKTVRDRLNIFLEPLGETI